MNAGADMHARRRLVEDRRTRMKVIRLLAGRNVRRPVHQEVGRLVGGVDGVDLAFGHVQHAEADAGVVLGFVETGHGGETASRIRRGGRSDATS